MASYIFDTDAGVDDVMTLAWLLARKDIVIEAITISYGLAHSREGAITMSRVVALSGQDIPVYIGQKQGSAAFPDACRNMRDRLAGIALPAQYKTPEKEPARRFLERRLHRSKQKVRIIALGALSNLADICTGKALEDLTIMGGAFEVPGNASPTAEWNIFVDPISARNVMETDVPTLIVPLDATNRVPVTPAFIDTFKAAAHTPLGRMTGQVLETIRHEAEEGHYYAWDPLAGIAMLHPEIVCTQEHAVTVDNTGTTHKGGDGPVKRIAYAADADAFMQLFLAPFR